MERKGLAHVHSVAVQRITFSCVVLSARRLGSQAGRDQQGTASDSPVLKMCHSSSHWFVFQECEHLRVSCRKLGTENRELAASYSKLLAHHSIAKAVQTLQAEAIRELEAR